MFNKTKRTADGDDDQQSNNVSVVTSGGGKLGSATTMSDGSKKIALIFVVLLAIIGVYFVIRSYAQSYSPTIDFQVTKHQSSDSTTISSPIFSTTVSNELVVAFIDSNGPGSRSREQSFQSVTGGGLSWTLRSRSNANNGTAEIWQAVAVNPVTNISVTATRAIGHYSGDITVVGFLNASIASSGATANNSAHSGAPNVSLKSTEANSWIWATGFDWDNSSKIVVGSNQNLVDSYVYRGESISSWTQDQSNPSSSAGQQITMNDTSPTQDRWDFAAIEILPSNTSSTPPVNTPPTAPNNLTGSIVNTDQVSLSWAVSSDSLAISKYTIYRAAGSTTSSNSYTAIATSTTNSYTDTTVTAGSSYEYYIKATDSAGNTSSGSNIFSISVPATTTGGGSSSGGSGSSSGGGGSSSGGGGTTTGGIWQPAQDSDWMWELSSPLDTTNASLMGTGITAYNGDTAPGDNPVVYDIDAIVNPASTVSALHTMGDHVICYIEVGTAGNYYSAAEEGISTTYFAQLQAAGDLSSNEISGYPEYFVNINQPSAVTIMESMIDQQCAAKGFDAVETDLDETFGNNEGTTPWAITQTEEESYLTTLANYMHSVGLGWIAKNLDDTGIQSFVSDMEPLAQGAISEQCNQYSSCSLLAPFEQAGKWIGNAEYAPETQAEFCSNDNAANINGVLYNVNLNGGRAPCR